MIVELYYQFLSIYYYYYYQFCKNYKDWIKWEIINIEKFMNEEFTNYWNYFNFIKIKKIFKLIKIEKMISYIW